MHDKFAPESTNALSCLVPIVIWMKLFSRFVSVETFEIDGTDLLFLP